jgi:hypothetical protein
MAVVTQPRPEGVPLKRPPRIAHDSAKGWSLLAFLGAALTLVGGGDIIIGLFPTNFGVPEWEFATVHQVISSLPLLTIGLFVLLASGVALGRRSVIQSAAFILLLVGMLILSALVVFLSHVPLALEAAPAGPATVGVKRVIAKIALLGTVFGLTYFMAAIAGLRSFR